MRRKLISVSLALTLALTLSTSVLADPINDQINAQQNLINQNKSSISKGQKSIDSIEGSIQSLDEQIYKINNDISDNDKKIAATQSNITKAEADIKVAEDKLNDEQEIFNERIKALYVSGTSSETAYLSVILQSKSLSDFISRIDTVKKIAELDKKIVTELNAQKADVQKRKAALEEENSKLVALKADNVAKLAKVNSAKQDQEKLIADQKEQMAKYAAQIQAETKAIKKLKDSIPKVVYSNPSRGGAANYDFSTSAVVAYAAQFLGKPYVWGGNGPDVFDCSGFTKYVYAHFGVDLPRVAADQANVGTAVSPDQLQPGDLLFFANASEGIHHVAMYIGNGYYIQAPHTGATVCISLLSLNGEFYCARRIK